MFPVRPAIGESFVEGMRIMQEQLKNDFLSFIQSTELCKKEKDLVKGVFYDWLNK